MSAVIFAQDDDEVSLDEPDELFNYLEIFKSIRSGNIETIKDFIALHSDKINLQSDTGNSLLATACRYSQREIAKFLLESGADPNMQNIGGLSPLHWACCKRDVLFVPLLTGYGCNPALKNISGCTALEHSKLWQNYELYSQFPVLNL